MPVLSLPEPTNVAPSKAASRVAPDSAPDPRPAPVTVPALVRHLAVLPLPARTMTLVTANVGGLPPLEAAVIRWAAARTRALVAKLRSRERFVVSYRPEVTALTGIGIGTVPTGDGLLVGLAAFARRLAAAGLLEGRAVAAFSASLSGLTTPETTPAARDLLEEAARGQFPAPLAAVIDLFGSPGAEETALKERAARLASASPAGPDSLAGVVLLGRSLLEWDDVVALAGAPRAREGDPARRA